MRINCVDCHIHIDQTVYLQMVLQCCGMQNAKSALMPLPAGYVPTKWDGVTSLELQSHYQTVIGSLLYLMLGTVIVLVLAFMPHSSVEPTTLKNAGNSCSPVKQLSCLAGHMVRHVLCHMFRYVLCHMIRRMFRHLTMTHHL